MDFRVFLFHEALFGIRVIIFTIIDYRSCFFIDFYNNLFMIYAIMCTKQWKRE